MIELDEARQALREAERDNDTGILQALRSSFPNDWQFPVLDAVIWEIKALGSSIRWLALREEIERAIDAQIAAVARTQEKAAEQRREASRKKRVGQFPNWMKDFVRDWSRGRKKPSPTLALDALKTRAADEGYTGALPTTNGVRLWFSRERT